MEHVPSRQVGLAPRKWSIPPADLALVAGLAMAVMAWTSGWFLHGDLSAEVIQISNAQPLIRGQTMPGITQAHYALFPIQLSWTGPVDPETGAFETIVPTPLTPGTYTLYLDDGLIAQFSVREEAGDP